MNKFFATATKLLRTAWTSLVSNIAYAIYYLVLAFVTKSWWMLTLGLYQFILSVVRFVVLRTKQRERSAAKFTGWMLVVLLWPLVGTVILAAMRDRGTKHHLIVMLVIAIYAFTKITLATISWIKSRNSSSGKMVALRYISFADAFVSIFALQRSMLVSFTGVSPEQTMTPESILAMNIATGSAVCVIVLLLGILLLCNRKINGSKLADPTQADTNDTQNAV